MKITLKKATKNTYPICPAFKGIGKIVDITELFSYEDMNGVTKEKFRVIIELNLKNQNSKIENTYWTIASRPMTPSVHEMALFRKFLNDITGKVLTDEEVNNIEVENLIGTYVDVIVEHVKVEDKTYANIVYIRPAPESHVKWESDYILLEDRDGLTRPIKKDTFEIVQ